jgi:hypothetical protein
MLGITLMALAAAGCQTTVNSPVHAELNRKPLIVDPAMQQRDWDRMVTHYANGDTLAGPDLVVIRSDAPDPYQRFFDPLVSATNDVMIPVTTVLNPPWKDVIYQGVVVPPTYNAQPAPHVIK